MRQTLCLVLGIIVSLIIVSLASTQEIQTEPETLWLWGEVVSVDIQNKTLSVKYLDFETDQEKEMSVNVDEKTTYENIKTLDAMKTKDNVSVDYIISPDGKNIARNIVVEKPEAIAEIPQEEVIPEKPESIFSPQQ